MKNQGTVLGTMVNKTDTISVCNELTPWQGKIHLKKVIIKTQGFAHSFTSCNPWPLKLNKIASYPRSQSLQNFLLPPSLLALPLPYFSFLFLLLASRELQILWLSPTVAIPKSTQVLSKEEKKKNFQLIKIHLF